MGRSVSTPAGAVAVAYSHFEPEDVHDPVTAQEEFEFYVEDLQNAICAKYPSMQPDDGWAGREDRIIASNDHAVAGISEYCGLVAIWLSSRDDNSHIGEHWLEQVADGFEATFGTLRKLGHASNGEAFFTAA